MKLTAKQELFVQGIISGLSQREAYKRSYDAVNMQDATIDSKASLLLKTDKIRARHDELLNEYKEKALWTREQAVNELLWLKDQSRTSIEESGVRQANSNALLSTIKELNTIVDLYPKKNAEPDTKESAVADALRGLADGIKSHSQTE